MAADQVLEPRLLWHPIASSSDLVPRHVYDTSLLGQEIAAWRADDGYANVWENRCLHRGVRLSIGINDGSELKCAYHGWRYANRSASCSYIPAHPADAPARTICNRVYRSREKYGLVWTALETGQDLPHIVELNSGETNTLRAMYVNANPELIGRLLAQAEFSTSADDIWSGKRGVADQSGAIVFRGDAAHVLVFFLHQLDAERTAIRGVLSQPAKADINDLRHFNTVLTRLRTKIEDAAARESRLATMEPIYRKVEAELATMPDRNDALLGLRAKVVQKITTAKEVILLELEGVNGPLPTGQAGAHIDVHLPNGLTRQYSLTNGPGETGSYVIGVKRERNSAGGSECLHQKVRVGDLLAVSGPRNNFPLRRDALRSIFVAGGIGITPLLSMAKTIENQGLDYELHYFIRSEDHQAFAKQIAKLKGRIVCHYGLDVQGTIVALASLYSNYRPAYHTYICGPGPMLNAAREAADACGWPDKAIHFEYFKNTNKIDDSSSFEISLARSGLTLKVNAGETVLEVLKKNGVSLASSCCQGACGTCKVAVIEGDVDHQDVHLTPTERNENSFIITCVSRAKSDRLVLDI